MHVRGRPLMSDIRDVIFPWDEFNTKELGTVQLPNGIEVAMWDMRESHLEEKYRLRVNVAVFLVGNFGFEEKSRQVFEGDQLLGHRKNGTLWLRTLPMDIADCISQNPLALSYTHACTCFRIIILTYDSASG